MKDLPRDIERALSLFDPKAKLGKVEREEFFDLAQLALGLKTPAGEAVKQAAFEYLKSCAPPDSDEYGDIALLVSLNLGVLNEKETAEIVSICQEKLPHLSKPRSIHCLSDIIERLVGVEHCPKVRPR